MKEDLSLDNIRKNFLKVINEGNADSFYYYLSLPEIKKDPDFVDEHGMSPLQHAAYKGNLSLCKALIDLGADPNLQKHDHGYRSLHFAALSGKPDVCLLLLDAGADSLAKNNIGKTAAQLAAFTGSADCSAIISNYVSLNTIKSFCKNATLNNPSLLLLLHQFLQQYLAKQTVILDHCEDVGKLLENLVAVEVVQKWPDANESLALKLHYFNFLLHFCEREIKNSSSIDSILKRFLQTHSDTGVLKYQNNFFMQVLNSFPHRHSPLINQLIMQLLEGQKTEQSFLNLFIMAVNGQSLFQNKHYCDTCHSVDNLKHCSRCHQNTYCSVACQKLHWFQHKKKCKSVH